jgi:probable rRNA maturation factor
MIDIEIEDERWNAVANAEDLVRKAAQTALSSAHPDESRDPSGDSAWAPAFAGVSGLSVLLTSDEAVRELNAKFRGKDQPTNVLSFPAGPNPENHLGDIALAFETCEREAAEQDKPLAHHLQHLVAHGALHLVGYDHQSDAEAEAMEALERQILSGLGVPDPYAATGQGDHG